MGAADLLERMRDAGFLLDVADDKLLVTPASRLTDESRVELKASKLELLRLLTGLTSGDTDAVEFGNTCADCANRLPRGTCNEPVSNGLRTQAEGFGIAWAPEGHARTCPAFEA